MASKFFAVSKLSWLKDNLNLSSGSFVVVPVEVEPTGNETQLSNITDAKKPDGSYHWKALQDIGGSTSNRIVTNAESGAAIHMLFQPPVWGSIATLSGDPIVGFVVLNTSSAPNSSTVPILYVDRLNTATGLPEAFTPDGNTTLAPDFTTYPLLRSAYGGQIPNSYRSEIIRDVISQSSATYYIALLESAPSNAWTQFSDMYGILAKVGADNNSLVKRLFDIDGNTSNRFYLTGSTVRMRFDNAVWANLTTDANVDITHYALIEGVSWSMPSGSSKFAGWNQVAVSGTPTPIVPNGTTKEIKANISIGFTI